MDSLFNGHIEDIIIDEIALEGLEGITLEGLWVRLAKRLRIMPPLRQNILNQIWNFILRLPRHFQFFSLPKPRPSLKIMKRSDLSGLDVQDFKINECPSQSYKFNPIEVGRIRGSCEFYKELTPIEYSQIKNKTLEEVKKIWGNKFIIVAVQHLREQALILDTHNPSLPSELNIQPYCTLERIGRCREYGEATIGRHSLTNMCNDSALIFYLRNRLNSLKLIVKQYYYEKSQAGSLLQLPRFIVIQRPIQYAILVESISFLKAHNGVVESSALKDHLGRNFDCSIKKFSSSSLFKKHVVSLTVPYRELHPNATPDQYSRKSNKNREKICKALKLIDMDVKVDDIFEENDAEDEETTKVFLCPDNQDQYASWPEQIYELVKSHGRVGISQTAIAQHLGLRKLCMRRLIKKMVAVHLLGFYIKDVGRQRLRMYVAQLFLHGDPENNETSIAVEEVEANETENKSQPSPANTNVPEYDLLTPLKEEEPVRHLEFSDKTEADFKMYVNEIIAEDTEAKKNSRSHLTEKKKLRRGMIVDIALKFRVVDTIQLLRAIVDSEQNLGYTDTICRKSLIRILLPMTTEKLVRLYEVRMEWREFVKQSKLVCASAIDIQHKLLTDELLKIKEAFFNSITMRRRRSQNIMLEICGKESWLKKVPAQSTVKQVNDRVGAAKYVRAKLIHEILFHLAYELKRDQIPISFGQVANAWKEFGLEIDANELRSELPDVYSSDVNWTMFLDPLPNYETYPEGWICINDFLSRIPLSIFAKMHRVDANTNAFIADYLKHPIRRFYTVRSLPLEFRDFIPVHKTYVRTLDEILRVLGYMGLIQFGPRLHRDNFSNYIFVNRKAVILDTTTSDSGYAKISEDREYEQMRFNFSCFAEVTEFWLALQNVCLATKLGYRKKRDTNEEPKRFTLKPLPEVPPEAAKNKDVGYIIGNGCGAGGLDWRLFAHKCRNWDLSYNPYNKNVEVVKFRPKMRYASVKTPQKGVRQAFFKRYKKQVVKRTKKILYDEIDKECIRRMDQLRVRWDENEDRLLLVCRVANNFMQGNTQQKATTAVVCRDILQWNLKSMQKSSRACQRRILYLMRKKSNVNLVNSWLNELYQNEYVNQTYGSNFLAELRKLYPTCEAFCNVARVYYVQLVSVIIQLLKKATIRPNDIIPDTLKQFNMLYRKSSVSNPALRHFDPRNIDEVNESTINLLIHSSVCSQRDKMLYNVQLFEIYRSYDEGMIERCFKKVRCVDQLVVTGKMMSKQKFPLLGKQVCISSVYRQQFYVLIPYSIYEQCHQSLNCMLDSFYRSGSKTPVKYTCVNSGTSILIMELILDPRTVFDIQIPKQVLKFDPSQIQNSAHTPDKVLDHFRSLVDENIQAEYVKEIPKDAVARSRKSNFNINVSVRKIVYNPYDTISRLTDSQIHFFCALQHLNSTVSLEDFMAREFHCPFRCVLQDVDYLATIQTVLKGNDNRIVQLSTTSNSIVLADIDTFEFSETTVELNNLNIVRVSNFIRDTIANRTIDDQKKDLGNCRVQKKQIDIVQLAYDALRYHDIDGYVSDEEELLAERGENNQRYQDFLVVNAPLLTIGFNEGDTKMVSYKEMLVPENLLPSFNKKEYVLEKAVDDAIWKYTDLTIWELEKEMNFEGFTIQEKNLAIDVSNYIETFDFGVEAVELPEKFPDEVMLLKCLAFLRKHYFIKRVGVGSFMYVHKNKVRPWIIHSFHVKRLEREAMTPQGELSYEVSKRKHDCDIVDEPNSKKAKSIPAASCSRGKRNVKPLSRYTYESSSTRGNSTPTEKIKVNMRPSPWIRVNGTLNRRVFDKWIGTILLECTIRCSLPVKNLFTRFHQLHPVNIMFLLECLRDLECIELKRCLRKPINLFSKDDETEVSDGNELTNPADMFVIVLPGSMEKLSLFIGDKKYQIDF